MLIQFSVENFMSIKNKIVLSMNSSNDNSNLENVIECTNENILKTAAIYGANASGKSNLYKALTSAILLVRRSNQRQIGEKLIEIVPFKFDSETIKKPSSFEFIFVSNGKKYAYGFVSDNSKIYEEYLYVYNSAKPSLVFERKNVTEYKFPKADEKILKEIKEKNIDNKLFLSTATNWNYSKTKDAFSWFNEKIDTYKNNNNLTGNVVDRFENDKDGELKKFTLKLLKAAEININNYKIHSKPIEMEFILPKLPLEVAMQIMNSNTKNMIGFDKNVLTSHIIKDDRQNDVEYFLDMLEESDGTQSLFYLSPILKEAFEGGKVVVIDEIDRSLHPILVKFVINLFNDKQINKNNAQLIFNTHDTNLLSLDFFRRDQIYFAEKNYESGITDLYSLDEFSVRKNENIHKGYLQGRYGAIPFLGVWFD